MPIQLQTPIATSVGSVLCLAMEIRLGVGDAASSATIAYVPCDGSGNITPGAATAWAQLAGPDLIAFFQGPGTLRQRVQLALQSALPSLAGTAT